jgi:hypothetical protein
MKRILISEKLLGVDRNIKLEELKTIYRKMIKEWHPDKLQNDAERLAVAEVRSKEIIDAYQFLVSISPETHATNTEEYARITSSSFIQDYEYKGVNLTITFQDGCVYEYLGIPKNIYIKMVNSGTVARFARRHIFNSYTYRKVSNQTED